MKSFWDGFFKKAEEENNPSSAAAIAAGAGGLAGAHRLGKTVLRERAEKKIPKSKNWRHFVRSLKPGDILVSKENRSRSKFNDRLLNTFGGSKHIHTQLYTGKGKLLQTAGSGFNVARDNAKLQLSKGSDVIALRPKLKSSEIKKGLKGASTLLGNKYETNRQIVGRGLKMLVGVPGKACHLGKGDRVVCTDVVAKAYPKVMPNRYSPVEDLQSSKHVTPVAHLNRIKGGRGGLFYKGLRPALSALKVGLPAYGIAKGIEALRAKKKEVG